MKLKLKHTRFTFTDEKNNQYDVTCPDAKRGENTFRLYKNGEFFGAYSKEYGHVNKTNALEVLKGHLNEAN